MPGLVQTKTKVIVFDRLICWKDLTLLLVGENVKLTSPKNQFVTDVCINTIIPILATSKAKIEYVEKDNTSDDREAEIMDVRCNVLEFRHSTGRSKSYNALFQIFY